MAYQYWRVYVDLNNGNASYTCLVGLDMLDSGMASLIGAGTAIASQEWAPNYTAPMAFYAWSSDSNNYWSTGPGGTSPNDQWIGYDFGVPVDVAYVSMTGVHSTTEMPRYMRIEASTDGVTWDRIAVLEEQTGWVLGGTDTRTFDLSVVGNARTPFIWDQPLHDGNSIIETSLFLDQPLHDGYSVIECSYFFSQALMPVFPEGPVSTEPLPGFGNSTTDPAIPAAANPFSTGLPGLSFNVHKRPGFKTNIKEAASGQETRNALMQYPRWEFELSYEYLYDQASGESSLQTLMGFFLSRQGSFDSWLFKDPDDYQVTVGLIGTGDGVVTDFYFQRTMGGFSEIVGQVDEVNTISIYNQATETGTIPATPWQVTVTHAADYFDTASVLINGVPGVRVASSPTAGQYSVAAGVYTFAAANQGQSYSITYQYTIDPADYTITAPNLISFDVAPANGIGIYATFQFYYQCRFLEDQQDYEKFMDRLWNLQSLEFKSILS